MCHFQFIGHSQELSIISRSIEIIKRSLLLKEEEEEEESLVFTAFMVLAHALSSLYLANLWCHMSNILAIVGSKKGPN